MKIGIIGSKSYSAEKVIKDFIFKSYEKFNADLIIYTIGDKTDVGRLTKKYSLLFGAKYGEYNPAYTGFNLYSMMKESYYDKEYNPSHMWHSIQCLVMNSERIFAFVDKYDKANKQWKHVLDAGKKYKKKVIFFE